MQGLRSALTGIAITAGIYASALHAAVPSAGTMIQNQAEVTYFNEALGVVETVTSNTVLVEVGQYPALTVDFDQTVYVPAGTVSQFGFFVTNTGNVPLDPTLTLSQLTGDDFDLSDAAIVLDTNGNGIAEAGEPVLASGDTLALPVGTKTGLIVTFSTPADVSDLQEGTVSLFAEDTAFPTAAAGATGTAVTSSSALTLEKQVNKSSAEAGDALRYTLRLRNESSTAITAYDTIGGEPIIIDGSQAAAPGGILVRDEIPLNVNFAAFVQSVNFTPLYHLSGTAEHTYRTTAPANLTQVDAIAWYFPGDYPGSFSADLIFEVATLDNVARSTIYNTASTWQQVGGQLAELESNTVATPVGDVAGALSFTDDAFNGIETTPLNSNTRIELNASVCNATTGVDTVEVRISTSPEGDLETVIATETGPNTGVFRTTSLPVQAQLPAVQENGVLSGNRATEATARAICSGRTLSDTLIINPGGVVFDAITNEGLPGAEVLVYDSNGAEVDRQITDANGFYQLSGIPVAGTHTIVVVPPAGYAFPSSRTVFPGFGRNVDPQASYGNDFTTVGAFFGIDIPLDPSVSGAELVVTKEANRTTAGPGDFIVYTVTIKNREDGPLFNTRLYDTLPSGVALVEDSALLEGKPVTVGGSPGPALDFDIGTIGGQAELTLSYIVHVKPNARGKLVNSASAEGTYFGSTEPVQSAPARSVVRVDSDGVFDKTGTVLGTVFVDLNGNGIQDLPASSGDLAPLPYSEVEEAGCGEGGDHESAGCVLGKVVSKDSALAEHGVPGVKIYFENGASVVTDELGRFSMPGLKAVTHVMAISRRSLPATLEPRLVTTRDALSPYSRFIDVKQGELRVESISLAPRPGVAPADVLAELEERRKDYDSLVKPDNIFWSEDELNLPGERRASSNRDKATLQTATEIIVEQAKARREAREDAAAAAGSDRSREIERTADLETMIRTLSPDLSFLDLEAEDVLDDDVVTIRAKGPAMGTLGLLVNGEAVSSDHVSQRTIYQGGNVQAIEYVAVKLKPGANDLLLTLTDPFGNVRQRQELTVYAPGKPAKLELIAPPAATANPSSPIPVLVRVLDADGLPTYASMDVTLEAKGGSHWDVRDIRESEPGIQAYIDGGEAVFDYYPPSTVGTHRIAVRNGLGVFETEIKLVADTSERLMAGVIEGAVRFGSDGGGATLIETDGLSPFEDTVEGVRGALYLKGKIRGGALLTLRYESDRDTEDRLFRDINPDQYYPVYGDTSERGFDAQSDGNLYVKVEKGLNYILYGDVKIEPQSSAFKLGRFSRSVTGGRAHFERGPVTIDLFAGKTDDEQVIREFRADGTSGPFELDFEDYEEDSEVLEIVTRDRNQPSIVVKTVRLQRYVDYRINYFDNTIIFNEPIPAFGDGFDPNFIRITYEVDTGGDDYWVYGGEVRYKINDKISLGYREIHSDADSIYETRRTVRAAYAEADMGKYGSLEVEGAQSIDQFDEEGYAGRVRYELKGKTGRLKVEAAKTDKTFDPPGSSVSSGREEVKVEAEHRLTERMKARGEAIYSRDTVTDDKRYGAEALVEYQLSKELALYTGGRYVREKAGDETSGVDDEVISAVFGARWKPARFPRLTVEGEVEGDLTDLSNLRFQGKTSYKVSERLRVYGEMEARTEGATFYDLDSSSGGDVMFRAGFEYAWTDHLTSFSEMRSGSRSGFANGLKADWEIDRIGGRMRAAIEHFQPYDLTELIRLPFTPTEDFDEEPVTTITLGYTRENTDKDVYLDLDAEASFQGGDYSLYGAQAFGRRHDTWTYMLQNRIAYADEEGGSRFRDHLRVGSAWRPGGPLTVLSLLGAEADFDDASGIDTWDVYWSVAGEYQVNDRLRIRGKQAGQYQATELGGVEVDSLLLLTQGGIEYDIAKRFVIGFNGTAFYDALNHDWYPGIGGEIGFVPAKNVLVSAGYNWAGVDDGLVDNVYTSGFVLRLRAKFDEETWDLFDKWGLTSGNGR